MANEELTRLQQDVVMIEQTLCVMIQIDSSVEQLHIDGGKHRGCHLDAMIPEDSVCYYGAHIGCPTRTNPNCRVCAERLTRAVNYAIRQDSK